MARVWRSMVFIVVASLLVAAIGRFKFLEVLAWAVFFGSLYWASVSDLRTSRCRL